MRRLVVLVALLVAMPAGAVTMDWTFVGDPGNACDPQSQGCFGAAPYSYWIGTYEVTNAQYAEFLNAKALSDGFALYNTGMGLDAASGITRSGNPGAYSYEVKAGFENKPVNYVSFYDALRFANWLNNGQGSGDTETGAYTLLGFNPATVTRNPGAITFLPDENEWYKAAYYDGGLGVYYDYPAGRNAVMVCVAPTATANRANCHYEVNNVTDAGAYTGSPSPYGTFDQGGNVAERTEQRISSSRVVRGGDWINLATSTGAATRQGIGTTFENSQFGFRVATLLPPPETVCNDGLDNDGDGLTDFSDPGCADATDLDEHDPTLPCDDGADNDHDGKADFLADGSGDPACWSSIASFENPQCQDGLDNDGLAGTDFDGGDSLDIDPRDGLIDAEFNSDTPEVGAADPQCVGKPWNNRETPRGCGLGLELVMLVPLLARLARRRRA